MALDPSRGDRRPRRQWHRGSDGRRSGSFGPALCTLAITALLGGIGGFLSTEVEMPPLLEILRLYLFVGIERIGALLGAFVGLALGLAVGLTVRLHRVFMRATKGPTDPTSRRGSR